MKRKALLTISVIVIAFSLFGLGVAASDLIRFTGDDQLTESSNSVEEIMQILRDVDAGKRNAEDALNEALERLEELEDMNPSGLAKENKRLREDNKRLNDEITALEEEVKRANSKVSEHHESVQNALNEARGIGR